MYTLTLVVVLILLFVLGKMADDPKAFEPKLVIIEPYVEDDDYLEDKNSAYRNWQEAMMKRESFENANVFEAPGSNTLYQLILEEFGAYELYQIAIDGQTPSLTSMYLMKLESWPH